MKYLKEILSIGNDETDGDTAKLKKSSLVILPLIIAPLAVIWGSLYLAIGHYVSAAIPLSYSLISFFNLVYFKKTHNITFLYYWQLSLVLLLPFLLSWSLGGFSASGYVFVWAFYTPIASIIYDKPSKSLYWFFAFILLLMISVFMDTQILPMYPDLLMPQNMIDLFLALNIVGGFSGLYLIFRYFFAEYTHDIYIDYLTGLHNRRYFYEASTAIIDKNIREDKNILLAIIDIDHFKTINDKWGHDIGDHALKEVSIICHQCFRSSDLIARFGGEEFCVLLDDSTLEDAEKLFQRVRKLFEDNNIVIRDKTIHYTVSIGAVYGKFNDINEMLKHADGSLYKAKDNGRNQVCIKDMSKKKLY